MAKRRPPHDIYEKPGLKELVDKYFASGCWPNGTKTRIDRNHVNGAKGLHVIMKMPGTAEPTILGPHIEPKNWKKVLDGGKEHLMIEAWMAAMFDSWLFGFINIASTDERVSVLQWPNEIVVKCCQIGPNKDQSVTMSFPGEGSRELIAKMIVAAVGL